MQRDAQEQNARSSRSPSSPAPTPAHALWMLMGNTEGIRGCAYLERLRPKECFRYPLLQEEGRRKEAFFSYFFLSFSLPSSTSSSFFSTLHPLFSRPQRASLYSIRSVLRALNCGRRIEGCRSDLEIKKKQIFPASYDCAKRAIECQLSEGRRLSISMWRSVSEEDSVTLDGYCLAQEARVWDLANIDK
ncbi:hypothetical protein NPIL_200891 [Nephila pilipes]|uniref:Uncharacterized protein n=1 Tax=Nephila pilipes TaxID=299642 RepID=A0A8X6NG41_NEPPI|nr:hypothetical protein NPIL_200891 [Nephila pilipes]